MDKKRWIGIILCVCFVLELLFREENFFIEVSAASKTKKAYEKILKQYSAKNHTFLSKDVNGDGIGELFIWQVSDDLQYSRIYQIYTYSNGKAKLLGTVDTAECSYNANAGQVYYDKKNHWFVTDDMGTVEWYDCYAIKNTKVQCRRSYSCHWKDDTNHSLGLGYYTYTGNKRKAISKAKYKAYLKSLQKLSGKFNTKSNRKKYL